MIENPAWSYCRNMPTLLRQLRCLRSYQLLRQSFLCSKQLDSSFFLHRKPKRWEARPLHVTAGAQLTAPLPPSFELRQYQQEAVDAVQQAFSKGVTRQLVCLPTGSGKTVIFCHLARALNKRTLILAHRVELLQQTAEKMQVVWPEVRVAMLNRRNRQFDAQVVIASVQTATRPHNLERLMHQGFDVIIVDEAHHAPAESYTGIFTSLEFLEGSDEDSMASESSAEDSDAAPSSPSPSTPSGSAEGGEAEAAGETKGGSAAELAPAGPQDDSVTAAAAESAGDSGSDAEVEDLLELEAPSLLSLSQGGRLLVGFTATAYRLDRKELRNVFQEIVYQQDVTYMIRQGYLVPPVSYRILTDQDLSKLTSSKGDFKTKQLEQLVNTPARNVLTVRSYASLAGGRKAVVFCVGIEHAQAMAAEFSEQGISCAAVHGKLSLVERESLLRRFKEGDFQVLTNCMILSEGYDETSVSCVVMARPTKSRGLYTQCIGRGLRLHTNKDDCVVIDMTDRHHNICQVASLDQVYRPFMGAADWEGNPTKPGPPKVKLNRSLPRGRITFINQKYTWTRFPNTPHYFISLFTPADSVKGGSSSSSSTAPLLGSPSSTSQPQSQPQPQQQQLPSLSSPQGVVSQPWRPPGRPPQWHIWLIACKRLPPPAAPQQEAQQPKRRRRKQGAPGGDGESAGEGEGATVAKKGKGGRRRKSKDAGVAVPPLRYLAYVMCEHGERDREASWQVAGPDASQREHQRPQQALPLDIAMTWAEQLIEEGFLAHAARNQGTASWRQKPASPKQVQLLMVLLKQAQREAQQEAQRAAEAQQAQQGGEAQQEQAKKKKPKKKQQDGSGVERLQREMGVEEGEVEGWEVGGEAQQDDEEVVKGITCGQASDWIGLLKVQEGYNEGKWRFPPPMYAG